MSYFSQLLYEVVLHHTIRQFVQHEDPGDRSIEFCNNYNMVIFCRTVDVEKYKVNFMSSVSV